jgi:hypothetical protein
VAVRTLMIALLLAAASLLGACGGDSKPQPTLVTTSTTVAVTLPSLPALHFTTPKGAVDHLILQWQAGDREAAAQAATPEAVDALFAKPAKAVQFRNCAVSPSANLGADCVYRYENGLVRLHLTVTNNDWRVATVTYEGA